MPTALAALLLAATISSSAAGDPSVILSREDGRRIPRVQSDAGATVQVQLRGGETITFATPHLQPGPRPRIVEFREAPSQVRGTTFDRFRRDLRVASESTGSRAQTFTPKHEFHRTFRGVAVTLDDATANAVRSISYVKAVHEDTEMRAFASEDATRIARLRVDRVWSELKTRGEGVTVAVLDTGVDYNHPALAGKVVKGFDWITHDEDPIDEHGHGTHVAGIIAGDTDDVRGVAPAATIVAHRVLDQYGRGPSSGIIAAIEAVFDPNYDGDFSDRVDIINLSLGGYGDADSPISLAVDNAVRAGVVVMLAAGNTPGGQSIGAPAAARLGITVGNAGEDDTLHFTSSAGPAFPDLAMKPEIVAPGEFIRSAKLGGGTLVASGTSMAAPHAAGVAALLLALHPDWKPEDVKAALTASAVPVDGEVMRQGAGRIDAYGAAIASSAASPAVVTFGRSPAKQDWTSSRTVRITNHSSATRTFTANIVTPTGTRMVAEPATFALEGGASRDVVLHATFDDTAPASTMTMSLGGRIEFIAAETTVRVPWIAIQGAFASVANAGRSSVVWGCDGPTSVIAQPNESGEYVALLPYRECGLVVWGIGERMKIVVQSHAVAHDLQLDGSLDAATHEVKLRGVDRDGSELADRADQSGAYYAYYRLDFPRLAFSSISTTTWMSEPLQVTTLPENVTISTGEALFDLPNRRIVSVHHPELRGISAHRTLTSLPADLRHARVEVPSMPGAVVQGLAIPFDGTQGATMYLNSGAPVPLDKSWTGDVYVTRNADTRSTLGAGLIVTKPDGQLVALSPAFRAIDGRIVVSSDLIPAPQVYGVNEGGTLALFQRLRYPGTFVDAFENDLRAWISFYGTAREYDAVSALGLSYKLFDGAGNVLKEGVANYSVGGDFGRRGAYRLEVIGARAQIAAAFDTSRTDFNPPSLSSMRVEGGRVLFSVADIQLGEDWIVREAGTVQSVKLFWRNAAGAWQEVAVAKTFDDRGDYEDIGHFATGAHFEAEVPASGHIDVRYDMTDTSGNTSSVTLNDIHGVAMKARAVRR
jgi:subtilisin family serine protease